MQEFANTYLKKFPNSTQQKNIAVLCMALLGKKNEEIEGEGIYKGVGNISTAIWKAVDYASNQGVAGDIEGALRKWGRIRPKTRGLVR